MHRAEIAVVSNRLRAAAIASALALLALTGLSRPCAAAGQEQNSDDVPSAPSRAPGRYPDPGADEFLPINKVVPRAKIILKEDERLPDLKAEETFAQYGSGTIDYVWYVRDPISPMYPFAYHPIYFEDMNLERCGLSCGCLQSVVSGLMFWGTVAILPYKVVVSPPCSCVYPPGFPPNDCPLGCRFSNCQNFIGPRPDFSRLFGYGSFVYRKCYRRK